MVKGISCVRSVNFSVNDTINIEKKPTSKVSKHIKHIKSTLDWSSAVFKVITAAFAFVNNIPLPGKIALKCTKIPAIFSTPYTVKDLLDNGKKLVSSRTSLGDRVRAGLKSIMSIDKIISSAASSIKILVVAKVIAKKFEDWTPTLGKVNFFLGFISLGFTIETFVATNKLRIDLNSLINKAEKVTTKIGKCRAWDKALERVESENIERLRTKLLISKKANLASRVHALRTALKGSAVEKDKAIEQSSEFMKILGSRVRLEFRIELAELINKVVGIAGSAFATFTPFFMIGDVVGLGTAVTSLLFMAGKSLLLRKNPFDAHARSKAESFCDSISSVPQRIQASFKNKFKSKIMIPETYSIADRIKVTPRIRHRPLAFSNAA